MNEKRWKMIKINLPKGSKIVKTSIHQESADLCIVIENEIFPIIKSGEEIVIIIDEEFYMPSEEKIKDFMKAKERKTLLSVGGTVNSK